MKLIVTLSSIPPRFDYLEGTLASLLGQSQAPDEIRLYIPHAYRRFPDWDGRLPKVPEGVAVCRPDCDYGPATKVLPAVRDLRGTRAEILFCDDDRIYDPLWTSRFLHHRKHHPDCALVEAGGLLKTSSVRSSMAIKVHKGLRYRLTRAATLGLYKPRQWTHSGFVDIAKGYGGVMIRSDFLPAEAFNIPDFLWTVDDYWISGLLQAQGIGIWLDADAPLSRKSEAADRDPLLRFAIRGHGRGDANAACVAWFQNNYGIWLGSEDNMSKEQFLPGPGMVLPKT